MHRTCTETGQSFLCEASDLRFYEHIDVPPPTLSPHARMRRRLAFRNERNLYRRHCDGTGQPIVSMYSPGKTVPVYDNDYWWGDGWDGLDNGRDIDFGRPFFPQFAQLLAAVPKMARVQQGHNENSRYTNCAGNNRNCYLCFSAGENEDCLYCQSINHSRECLDCLFVTGCELAYECCYCSGSYDVHFCRNVHNSSTMRHCADCRSCDHCFGCVGLRRGSYMVLNEPVTRAEFELLIEDVPAQKKTLEQFAALERDAPRLYTPFLNCEDFSGGYLLNCKSTYDSWNCSDLEDCRFCGNLRSARSCYDVDFYGVGGANELLYECEGVGQGTLNVRLSKLVWGGSHQVTYAYECFACRDIFGCAGLKRKDHCILNRQYSPAGYEELSARLIRHMRETGEWGQFFPVEMSLFGYNETLANNYFPLDRSEAEKLGWKWHEDETVTCEDGPPVAGAGAAERDPYTRLCSRTHRPFKLVKPELMFYEKSKIGYPALSPEERHRDRIATIGPRRLYQHRCQSCQLPLETMYDPANFSKILCETCYLGDVG